MQHIARLFVENELSASTSFELEPDAAHYINKVMRLRLGDTVRLFNGRDGEWSGQITQIDRRKVAVHVERPLRSQIFCPDIEIAFAPIKRSRMEFIAEKSTELGVRALHIVRTRYSNQKSVRMQRLCAISREAAEQTERLDLPKIHEETTLVDWLQKFPADRALIFCDESGDGTEPLLTALDDDFTDGLTVLVGPEGGFAKEEQILIQQMPAAIPVSLGPRILRADTAAIVALGLIQAKCGDWAQYPITI